MTTPYFEGKRLDAPLHGSIDLGGDEYLSVAIFKYWSKLSPTISLKCGAEFNETITGTVSVTETTVSEITSSVGSKIQAKDLAELNSQLTAKLSRSVSIQLTKATSITVKKSAPPCGACSVTFYELIRQYEFRYGHYKGFFNTDFVEDVYTLDVPAGEIRQEGEQAAVIPECGCAEKDKVGYLFKSRLEFGEHFAMVLPSEITTRGEIRPVGFTQSFSRFGDSISVSSLPDEYRYVGEIVPKTVRGIIFLDQAQPTGLKLTYDDQPPEVPGAVGDSLRQQTDVPRTTKDCGPPAVTVSADSNPNQDRNQAVAEANKFAREAAQTTCTGGNCGTGQSCKYLENSITTTVKAAVPATNPATYVATATTTGLCHCE